MRSEKVNRKKLRITNKHAVISQDWSTVMSTNILLPLTALNMSAYEGKRYLNTLINFQRVIKVVVNRDIKDKLKWTE